MFLGSYDIMHEHTSALEMLCHGHRGVVVVVVVVVVVGVVVVVLLVVVGSSRVASRLFAKAAIRSSAAGFRSTDLAMAVRPRS